MGDRGGSQPLTRGSISFELNHGLYFNCGIKWKTCSCDCYPGMPAPVAEYIDKKIGCAVDNLRAVDKIGPGIDKTCHGNEVIDGIE